MYAPVYDVAVGPIIALALCTGIGIFTVVILLEAAILKLLKWDTFRRSLIPSLTANFISTFAGYLISSILGSLFTSLEISIPGVLFVFFISSCLIEGIVLWFFKRNDLRQVVIASLVMNTGSYLLIILPFYFFNITSLVL